MAHSGPDIDTEFARAAARTIEVIALVRQKLAADDALTGAIDCPHCGGRVGYSVHPRNKHTQGACSTKGCVSWIE